MILINKFNVKPEEADQFLKMWEKDATYFKSQHGCISAQLHRGIDGSGIFVNLQFGNLLPLYNGFFWIGE
jgi:quinol monooxygenase YgiN